MTTARSVSSIATIVAGLAVFVFARPVEAGIGACGDIHVEAGAQCEVLVEGGCEVSCEPLRMEAACAADLYASCEGQCDASASVDCSASCHVECTGQCEVDPGSFECSAACQGDCEGACDARCSSDESECHASCVATCSGHCDARCEVEPASASCDARCDAGCEGSCEAQANVDCQVQCQAGGFVECEAELSGGCEAECRAPEGALFCDGQYVDHGGNLRECIDALEASLEIEVQGSAMVTCVPGRCDGTSDGSISCAVDSSGGPSGRAMALSAIVLLLTMAGYRRLG